MGKVRQLREQAGARVTSETKIRKNELYSCHRSYFMDEPNYLKCPFTDRDQRLIAGERAANFRKLDITRIINKAEAMGQYDIAEQVYAYFGYLFHEVHNDDHIAETIAASTARRNSARKRVWRL